MSGNVRKKFKAKVPKEKGAEKKEIAEVLTKYEDFDQVNFILFFQIIKFFIIESFIRIFNF